MANKAWIERQTRTPRARRRYEEERLILWTAEEIARAMEKQGLSRAEVADKLGTSRANITQLLSGSRNMTLRSLAALAHACGMRAGFHLGELTDSVFTPIQDHTIRIRPQHGSLHGQTNPWTRFDPPEVGTSLHVDGWDEAANTALSVAA